MMAINFALAAFYGLYSIQLRFDDKDAWFLPMWSAALSAGFIWLALA